MHTRFHANSLEERAKIARCNIVCCLLYNTFVLFTVLRCTTVEAFDNIKILVLHKKISIFGILYYNIFNLCILYFNVFLQLCNWIKTVLSRVTVSHEASTRKG